MLIALAFHSNLTNRNLQKLLPLLFNKGPAGPRGPQGIQGTPGISIPSGESRQADESPSKQFSAENKFEEDDFPFDSWTVTNENNERKFCRCRRGPVVSFFLLIHQIFKQILKLIFLN